MINAVTNRGRAKVEKAVAILGSRGVPAAHGGFETLAERLSGHLVSRGWKVTVYCQSPEPRNGQCKSPTIDYWNGVRRVTFQVGGYSGLETVVFDWKSIKHAFGRVITKAYFGLQYRGFRSAVEDKESAHYSAYGRNRVDKTEVECGGQSVVFLEFSYRKLAWRSDCRNHPELISRYGNVVNRHKISMITYGADPVGDVGMWSIRDLRLVEDRYFLVIARVEPDNNVLTIVTAFSRKRRNRTLVVVGKLDEGNKYHRMIRESASEEVIFPGPIYDQERVRALRRYARAYLHGHMVGGTNPSLVEALWAGSAVIAHRNPFNTWTAGPNQFFFDSASECSEVIDRVISDEASVQVARRSARIWAEQTFSWRSELDAYESLLESFAVIVSRGPAKGSCRCHRGCESWCSTRNDR